MTQIKPFVKTSLNKPRKGRSIKLENELQSQTIQALEWDKVMQEEEIKSLRKTLIATDVALIIVVGVAVVTTFMVMMMS